MKIFHVTPIGKPRMTQRDKWKKRPCVLQYFAYRDQIRLLAGRWLPEDGDIAHFYIPFPKSYSKKKRAELLGEKHREKPDVDNVLKAFLDCFGEDKHIADYHPIKFWAAEGSIQVWRGDE